MPPSFCWFRSCSSLTSATTSQNGPHPTPFPSVHLCNIRRRHLRKHRLSRRPRQAAVDATPHAFKVKTAFQFVRQQQQPIGAVSLLLARVQHMLSTWRQRQRTVETFTTCRKTWVQRRQRASIPRPPRAQPPSRGGPAASVTAMRRGRRWGVSRLQRQKRREKQCVP